MLTDDDFTYGGVDYHVSRIVVITNANLIIDLDKTIPASLKSALTLNVGNARFALADGTSAQRANQPQNSQVRWSNSGLSWSIGDTVSLSLTEGSTTPTDLVTNASETVAGTHALLDATRTVAQAFQTGSNSGGYTLTSIEVQFQNALGQAARNALEAQIWSDSGSGTPSAQVVDLTVPAHPINAGTVSFTAPSGATLDADSTYWLLLWGNPINNHLKTTTSDDQTGETGWTIENTFRRATANPPTGSSTWATPTGGRSLLLTVKGAASTATTPPSVSISASPTTVDEGSPVTITLTLSRALSSRVTIPLVVYDFSSEPGDYGRLASITIPANSITGTGIIATRHDADIRDDVFGVDLGTLPPEVVAGSPVSVAITIVDDDYPDTLSNLQSLPIDYSLQRPASERTPTGAGAGAAYCYVGAGSGNRGSGGTEYIRYPDGRIAETTIQDPVIRSMFACD